MKIIPIRTRIITDKDDLIEVLRQMVVPKLRQGDGIVIASKVVSITQGRIVRPDQVTIGVLARYGARFFRGDGNLSSPYSLQAVIDEVGSLRVILAFIAGIPTRVLLRRKGDFCRVAGIAARTIDDVGSNPPPFDKHMVLAPLHPGEVAASVKRALGYDCAIVDSNDLGKVDVLGSTEGINVPEVYKAFSCNPLGNDNQQQPFAVMRR